MFNYIDTDKRKEFVEYLLEKVNGMFVLEGESKKESFKTIEEVVSFTKTITGKIQIYDDTVPANIFLIDGECVWYEDEWNLHRDYLAEVWRGFSSEEEFSDGEKNRYSVYDVYTQRELL